MVKEIIEHWDSNRNPCLDTKIVQFSIEDCGKCGGEGGDEGGDEGGG